MNDRVTADTGRILRPAVDDGWRDRMARRLTHDILAGIGADRIGLSEGSDQYWFGHQGERSLCAEIKVRDREFYRRVMARGSLGAGEAYMERMWDCSDLTTLCRIVLRSQIRKELALQGSFMRKLFDRTVHAFKRNSLMGARRNIAAHYDLGNEFFRLFLDANMMYSCAIFPSSRSTLEEASDYKVDRICKKLQLSANDHLLEIGAGWGGLALHAARNYGCRVTTTTISLHQCELARERVTAAGLEGRVEVLFRDYRDLSGCYDKLVSVEMIEAVGHQYQDTYFRQCGSLLKPDGLMLLQAICIADRVYDGALQRVDFIKKHIFPGSYMPCLGAMAESIKSMTDLRIVHLEDIGTHYARTLRCWRERFMQSLSDVRELGYSEAFIRMWEFYLSYCEASFEERYNSDVQVLLAKPLNRHDLILPQLP